MKSIKRMLTGPLVLVLRGVYAGVSLIEAPLYLARHRDIFKNEIVYVFFHWSFGHTITGIDYASRLYDPHRISLVYVPHPGSNAFLPFSFEHNVDAFVYSSVLPSKAFGHVDRQKYLILRFYLLLISALTNRFQVIELFNLYHTISLAQNRLLTGNSSSGRTERLFDYTGYIRLLREGIGKKPRLPSALQLQCRNAIEREHPNFFQKPYATLLLRGKGKLAPMDSRYRCSGPHENYHSAVEYLGQRGYTVVGMGETDDALFVNLPNFIQIRSAPGVPKPLLSLYLLMNSALFIGNQSGPLNLCNICDIPSVICDAVPYRLGTFRADDIILFKPMRFSETGKRLSLVDVFREHQDLAYGHHFKEKNVEVEFNSSQEILEAVKETLSRLEGTLALSEEDEELCAAFRRLPTEGMGLHYQGNRTSLHILRQLKEQLLTDRMSSRISN